MENAVCCGDTNHCQGCDGHGEGKKGAGVFQDGAKRIWVPIHIASLCWSEVLTKGRTDYVCQRARATAAVEQEGFELVAVALLPEARVEAREQASESRAHNAS